MENGSAAAGGFTGRHAPGQELPKRQFVILLLAITLLAAALRLYAIQAHQVWMDEASDIGYTAGGPVEIVKNFYIGHSHVPPLHFIILHAFIKLFATTDVLVLRYGFALIGIVAVLLFGLALATGFDRRTALLGAILMALHPYLVYWDQSVRIYASMNLLTVTMLWSFFLIRRRHPLGPWLYLGSGILGLYLHLYFVLTLVAVNAAFLLLHFSEKEKRGDVRAWCLLQIVVAAFFSAWLPVVLYNLLHSHEVHAASQVAGLAVLPRTILTLISGNPVPKTALHLLVRYGLGALAGLLLLASLFQARKTKSPAGPLTAALAFVLPILVAYGVGLKAASFNIHYLTGTVAPLLAACAFALARLGRVRWLVLALLGGGFLFQVGYYYGHPVAGHADYANPAAVLQSSEGAKTIIYLNAPFIEAPFRYYYRGGASVCRVEKPVLTNPRDYLPQPEAGYDLWLVLRYDDFWDPDATFEKYLRRHYRLQREYRYDNLRLLHFTGDPAPAA